MKKETEGWVFFADKDMLAANALIQCEDLMGAVTFHCQQAIEKYFKAYLVENGQKVRKIHDLVGLYHEIKVIHDWKLDENLIKKISDIYTETRYPGNIAVNPNGSQPTPDEAQKYLDFALHVESVFKSLVP